MENKEIKEIDFSKTFEGLFQTFSPTAGEEEILRIASQYALQLTAPQIKILMFLKIYSLFTDEEEKKAIETFLEDYLKYKRFHLSDKFIMKCLETISLKKFLGENWLKVNIEK